jgi:alkylation response protein AidB-like acyl-CoA dehydrogenase
VDLELTPEQAMIRDTARDLAAKEILPKAAKIDQEHRFPARSSRGSPTWA